MIGEPTNEEIRMFREAYEFFKRFCDPPANQDKQAPDWWCNAAAEVAALDNRWKDYPLMRGFLMAIYDYLEAKSRQKTKELAHFE